MTSKIDHLVVVMLENRSFDNMLGWLYTPEDPPEHFIPDQNPPPFDGLAGKSYSNKVPGKKPVPATKGTFDFIVPNPDPNELFLNMNRQIFGTKNPKPDQTANMSGFLKDFASIDGVEIPDQIMQSYSPSQVPVLSSLARNYAVCDRWFGSAPCQTWPNRAFAHAGTSCGRVNNCDKNEVNCIPDPGYYNTPTIFNVLKEQGHDWAVYNDTILISLTRFQFWDHLGSMDESHFRSLDDFKQDAKKGKLPQYSFVEPSFLLEPNDQHPAHNVTAGEKFLYEIWQAVSTGKNWNSTLLLITYDEHGGCYDHCSPPWGATPPDNAPPQKPFNFKFDRYGPRVPTVLVSPYIEPGTVFRAKQKGTEYDHTSILATIREWLNIPEDKMLASERIKKAPTFQDVLTLDVPRKGRPAISKPLPMGTGQDPQGRPLTALQRSVIEATVKWDQEHPDNPRLGIPPEVLESMVTDTDAVQEIIKLLANKNP